MAAEAVLGPWVGWRWAVFLNREDTACGESAKTTWGTGSNGGFSRQGLWKGWLKPGDRIEIALMPAKPDEWVEFTFDRSALRRK